VLHDGEPQFALSQKGSASRLYFLFSNTAAAKKSLRFDHGATVTQVDYFTSVTLGARLTTCGRLRYN